MKLKLLLTFCVAAVFLKAQNYTWVHGANFRDMAGVYNGIANPLPANTPGARSGAVSWKDNSGNLWLFGGFGFDQQASNGLLGDLWVYEPATNMWQFVKGDSLSMQMGNYGTQGVPAPTNKPGTRVGATGWTDFAGNLWLFGGIGIDNSFSFGELNDLWKYNIATNQWTWVRGSSAAVPTGNYGTMNVPSPTNDPGGRVGPNSWVDGTGKVWLFGGQGIDGTSNSGSLNDLWRYDPATNEWTWIGGNNVVDQTGIYGTLSVPSTTNMPGSRALAASWIDASNNLWLFGGNGLDGSSFFPDALNDLWRYNTTTNEWTWMGGANVSAQNGQYGTLGSPSPNNVPGSRFGHSAFRDNANMVYIFGGFGLDASSLSQDAMNDLWKFNMTTSEWTWIHGSNTQLDIGSHGTLGMPAITNSPPSRAMSATWSDASGNFWLMGGNGFDGQYGDFNDLWKFKDCMLPSLVAATSNSALCGGETVSLTASGAATYTWSNPTTLLVGNPVVVSPTVTTSYTITAATSSGCIGSAVFTQTVVALNPTVTITSSKPTTCSYESTTVTLVGANSYSWHTSSPSSSSITVINPSVTTVYTVTGFNNTCFHKTTFTQTVGGCVGIASGSQELSGIRLYPNPSNGTFRLHSDESLTGGTFHVYSNNGQEVKNLSIDQDEPIIVTGLAPGVYHYRVSGPGGKAGTGRLIIE